MVETVTTIARKRKKRIPTSLRNSNPGNARKVTPDPKTEPSLRVTNPDSKAISLNRKETARKETKQDVTSPKTIVDVETDSAETGNVTMEASPIHPNNKERNQPEMKNLLKHKKSLRKSLILLFAASLCMACDEQTVYHTFQSLPTEGWQRKDTLFFDITIPDSATLYNISVEVRNRNNYPYQNLPLLIYYDSPEAQNIKKDTLEMKLADSAGIWLGDGWGGLYQSTLRAGLIRIGKAGEYRFKITHLLPDEVLPGINDVGIRLKR